MNYVSGDRYCFKNQTFWIKRDSWGRFLPKILASCCLYVGKILYLCNREAICVATWPEFLQMRYKLFRAKAQNKAYVPFTTNN